MLLQSLSQWEYLKSGLGAHTKNSSEFGLSQMFSNASMVAEAETKGIFSRPFAVHIEVVGVLKNVSVSVC